MLERLPVVPLLRLDDAEPVVRTRQGGIDGERLGERRGGPIALASHQIDGGGIDEWQTVARIGGARAVEHIERLAPSSGRGERHAVRNEHVDIRLCAAHVRRQARDRLVELSGFGQVRARQSRHVLGSGIERQGPADHVRRPPMMAGFVVEKGQMDE